MNSSSAGGSGFNTRMSSEEMLSQTLNWNLGCDTAVLNRLKDYSDNMLKRAEAIKEDCNSCVNEVELLQTQVQSVTNQFLILANDQFVENCVEEFEERDSASQTLTSPLAHQIVKTKAEKEAELIMKMKESIKLGIHTNSLCDHSSSESAVKTAHLIGTPKFFSSRYCGLVDESHIRAGFYENTVITPGITEQIYSPDTRQGSSESISIPKAPSSTDSEYQYGKSENVQQQQTRRESSLSSEDNFLGISQTPLTSSSNSVGTSHSHDTDLRRSDEAPTTRAPISIMDDLNKVLRARVPPPPATNSDSEDDFKPKTGTERNLFVDVDDDEDIFKVNSAYARKSSIKHEDRLFQTAAVLPKIPSLPSIPKQINSIADIIKSQPLPPKSKPKQGQSVFASDSDDEGDIFSSSSSTTDSKNNASREEDGTANLKGLYRSPPEIIYPILIATGAAKTNREADPKIHSLPPHAPKVSESASAIVKPNPTVAKTQDKPPKLKTKQAVFADSDSDDDLFSASSSKGTLIRYADPFSKVITESTRTVSSLFGPEKNANLNISRQPVTQNLNVKEISKSSNISSRDSDLSIKSTLNIGKSVTVTVAEQKTSPGRADVFGDIVSDIDDENLATTSNSNTSTSSRLAGSSTSAKQSVHVDSPLPDSAEKSRDLTESKSKPMPKPMPTPIDAEMLIASPVDNAKVSSTITSPEKSHSILITSPKSLFKPGKLKNDDFSKSVPIPAPRIGINKPVYERPSSFDIPPTSSELLNSFGKNRVKILQNRRRPTRRPPPPIDNAVVTIEKKNSSGSELKIDQHQSETDDGNTSIFKSSLLSKILIDNGAIGGIFPGNVSTSQKTQPPLEAKDAIREQIKKIEPTRIPVVDLCEPARDDISTRTPAKIPSHSNSKTKENISDADNLPSETGIIITSNSVPNTQLEKNKISVTSSTNVNNSSTIGNSNNSQKFQALPTATKPQLTKNVKQSVFEDSDSDSDIFSSAKSVRTSKPNTQVPNGSASFGTSAQSFQGASQNRPTLNSTSKISQASTKSKQKSIFQESDSDGEDDLFASSKFRKSQKGLRLNGEHTNSTLFNPSGQRQTEKTKDLPNLVEQSSTYIDPGSSSKTVESQKKNSSKLKQKSIFDDSDSDNDIFSSTKSTR